LIDTNLHLVICHSTRCAGRLEDSQIQHRNDESQHKLGEIVDLQSTKNTTVYNSDVIVH